MIFLSCMFVVPSLLGQEVKNVFAERLAMRNAATQHYAQFYQQRGNWLAPDLCYVDYGKSNYRENFFGGGKVFYRGGHLVLTHEEFFGQTSGSASNDARYLLPWTKAEYTLAPKLAGSTVYFVYVPLNDTAKFHQTVERAKLEYDFKKFKFGAGYAGAEPINKDWQNKPMVTLTLKCGKFGALEFWGQRLPGNHAQLQVRYLGQFFSGKHQP